MRTTKQHNEVTKIHLHSRRYGYGTSPMTLNGKVGEAECIEFVKRNSGLFKFVGNKDKGDWKIFVNNKDITKDVTGESKEEKDSRNSLRKLAFHTDNKEDSKEGNKKRNSYRSY